MKIQKKSVFSFIFFLLSTTVQADHFPVGSDVLANCHGFFTKGKIKRLHKERYVVHFYKDARPVHCIPFAWDSMFLVPYKPIDQYTGKVSSGEGVFGGSTEKVLKVGDKLKIFYKASERGSLFDKKYTVESVIKEINVNGAGQLETIGGEEKAQRTFQRWVGTNYVTLDFSSALVADRLTILKAEKQ
ncbi:MAG: hypothetical protein L3J59_10910 [Methylococcaceae bacterium]|nr:hypothetical protein [Methylococcaceae bacterium]